ncbi:phospholipase A2 A2-actitoxin-Cgg2a isoform X2 [Nematostella vectensis]|nr:phospholipase A2 A2-actitoxin-Cgg2a isoform X2 [Nematostella vectensis]
MSTLTTTPILLVLIFVAMTTSKKLSLHNAKVTRDDKRGALDFYMLSQCITGRDPADFNGYGCYCGLGGEGFALDDLDRCCVKHDNCYGIIQDSGICGLSFNVYTLPYTYSADCKTCDEPSAYWFYGKCRHALCLCDLIAAKCFKETAYNEKYRNYDKGMCTLPTGGPPVEDHGTGQSLMESYADRRFGVPVESSDH